MKQESAYVSWTLEKNERRTHNQWNQIFSIERKVEWKKLNNCKQHYETGIPAQFAPIKSKHSQVRQQQQHARLWCSTEFVNWVNSAKQITHWARRKGKKVEGFGEKSVGHTTETGLKLLWEDQEQDDIQFEIGQEFVCISKEGEQSVCAQSVQGMHAHSVHTPIIPMNSETIYCFHLVHLMNEHFFRSNSSTLIGRENVRNPNSASWLFCVFVCIEKARKNLPLEISSWAFPLS